MVTSLLVTSELKNFIWAKWHNEVMLFYCISKT